MILDFKSPPEAQEDKYEKQIKENFLKETLRLCENTNQAIYFFFIILCISIPFLFIIIPILCFLLPDCISTLMTTVGNGLMIANIVSVLGILTTLVSNVLIGKYFEYKYNKLLGNITINELFAVEKLILLEDKFPGPSAPDTISFL